jgi:tetrahydromethanopterin S-methyltransferase subunit G
MRLDSPAAVMGRLSEIEDDMATRQVEYEQAAGARARLIRDWERRLAICMRQAPGTNAEMRKANALIQASELDDLHDRLTEAEAAFEALRVVMKVLSDRSMIGMAVLRAQGRGG